MPTRHVPSRVLPALTLTLASALVLTGLSSPASAEANAPITRAAAPSPTAINTADRQSVIDSWRTRWLPAMNAPFETIGDPATCTAGTPSAATMNGAATAVNWARDMVGSTPVSFTPERNALAQQASLVLVAGKVLTHYPAPTAPCYSTAAATGAAQSNLTLGYLMGGVESIRHWLESTKGHRDWVLDPNVTAMGFGTVVQSGYSGSAAALHVISDDYTSEPHGDIAWPTPGYFPEEMSLPTAPWSYVVGRDHADVSNATVTLTRLDPGGPVPVPVTVSASMSAVYFKPTDLLIPTVAGRDVTYQVRISGITIGGSGDGPAVQDDIVYNVTLVTARPAGYGLDGQPEEDNDVPSKISVIGKVKLRGKAKVGSKLTVKVPELAPSTVKVSIHWIREGRLIRGANRVKYRLKRRDAGHHVYARVIARAPEHTTRYLFSPKWRIRG